jgi:hypothetical protein
VQVHNPVLTTKKNNMEIKQTQKRINIHHTTSVDGILYGRSESLTYDTNGILVEHEIDWTVGDENGKGPYVTPSGPLDHISKETPASLEEKFKEIIEQQEMSKRVKINFEIINKERYEIIPPEKVAESRERIKQNMKTFIKKINNKK